MANKQIIIGKTAPVPLGQQRAVNSMPVVFAEDQPPLPVEEQNKIQSEVALSLLGIPRAEVALGIFADVNTYDVNPSEWSQFPIENDPETGSGVYHIDKEAGAELVASEGRTTILTSKRFFRYQPGRVSSSTMGVKMNRTKSTYLTSSTNAITLVTNAAARNTMKGAPTIKKWGIFDKFDGYYFEIINGGDKNDFRCIRRTQALVPYEPPGTSSTPERWTGVISNPQGKTNMREGNWGVVGVDPVIYRNGLCYVAAAIYDPSLCYHPDDVRAIEKGSPLSDFVFNENYALRLAYRDETNQFVEHLADRKFQFPFDQRDRDSNTFSDDDYRYWELNGEFLKPSSVNGGQYIRLDAHCRWEDLVTNLSRGGGSNFGSDSINDGINLITDTIGQKLDIEGFSPRFGYDSDPSPAYSGVKVWNLLVSTQGSTQIQNNQYSAAFPTPHRTNAYDVNNSSPGRKNVTLKEWFKICVPPQYRNVYEWRPVRAMFSNDQLNGLSGNVVRWSDVSTATVDPTRPGVKRPGDIIDINTGVLTDDSVYDVDFSKVTMWKIEFSWYGAVGALFLCYVPVGNGEARWVRVHHMRASNQLDVASLGNATLPITYLTHAGLNNGLIDNKSTLVKYGASYYIDGGDKGTVKLLSKSSDYAKSVSYSGIKTNVVIDSVFNNYFDVSVTDTGIPQSQKDQLIGAYLKSDTTMTVIWVKNESTDKIRLYFNRDTTFIPDGSAEDRSIELVLPRRQRSMITLRAKDEVSNSTGTPIRNRIQLYPVKYGIGVTDPSADKNILTINFIKNPLLITNNIDNSTLSQTYDIAIYDDINNKLKGFEIGSGTVPVQIVPTGEENISSTHWNQLTALLPNSGSYIHCYMRGRPTASVPLGGFSDDPSPQEMPVLVRLFKKGSDIYVQNYSSQTRSYTTYGSLLPIRMYQFDSNGLLLPFTGTFTHSQYSDQKKWNESGNIGTFESIAQLSGASVSQDFRLAPVANTGNIIFSLYTNPGGDQYDLQDYFSYNKEYISYPLTDEVDILCAYAMWESTSSSIQPPNQLSVVNSLTWEEQ